MLAPTVRPDEPLWAGIGEPVMVPVQIARYVAEFPARAICARCDRLLRLEAEALRAAPAGDRGLPEGAFGSCG